MSAAPTRRSSPLREVSPELAHCSTERRFELLGQAQFFSHLSEAELTEVNGRFQEVHYGAGDWIWHPGDEAREMFIVADRKSTRLNSSHVAISYAVFCLKKKKGIIRTKYK